MRPTLVPPPYEGTLPNTVSPRMQAKAALAAAGSFIYGFLRHWDMLILPHAA